MAERIIVSGGDRLRAFACPGLVPAGEAPLCGSGALCAGGGKVFAASDGENAVYRLCAGTLLPESVYAAGPQVRALCLSPDGARLYALLSGADSVLMLCAGTGAPLLLARVGVSPQSLRLDDTGERLVIAGGRDGCAYVLCARTLCRLACGRGEGFCADASLHGGRLRALRFFGEADCAAPGKLIGGGNTQLLLHPLSERLYIRRGRVWLPVCEKARDAAVDPSFSCCTNASKCAIID